jgi:hypothetical protein
MGCPDCQAASERMHHGFKAGCDGCKARAIRRVRDAGRLDRDYQRLLDSFGLKHEQVKEAAKADKLESA